jgi:carbonyl reductase 1
MKRVVVSGGNKGIGKAICQLLLEKHPDVHVILGSRDVCRGEKAVMDLKKAVPGCEDRLEMIELDTSSDDSVKKAAEALGGSLYGIVNNAGIGFGQATEDNVNVNYFGPRRMNTEFGKLLEKPGGRIVNIASASGPYFIAGCGPSDLRSKLTNPMTIGSIDGLDKIAKSTKGINDGYGYSKALLNAYTMLHAAEEPKLIINSCSPGYIKTDITAGMGATNPPSKGAVPPVYLLMSPDFDTLPTGRYYGSDCVRSPIHVYRGPGDPPYEGE